ncbi:MAG: hypothetical protein LBV51_06030 [Acholeplasmatales bacterium]|jgi:hypothetical protein|nr:hypothetical protein [Acholeplasmatales bacterium]
MINNNEHKKYETYGAGQEEILHIIKDISISLQNIHSLIEELTKLLVSECGNEDIIECASEAAPSILLEDEKQEEPTRTFRLKSINTDDAFIRGKYRRLSYYFGNATENEIILKFEEIENIIGEELPKSAYDYREFWANSTSRPIALTWLNAGYMSVSVDLLLKVITFEKQRKYPLF